MNVLPSEANVLRKVIVTESETSASNNSAKMLLKFPPGHIPHTKIPKATVGSEMGSNLDTLNAI